MISSTRMRSPKSLHNLQHDEGGNYMAETETETETGSLALCVCFVDRCLFFLPLCCISERTG